MTVVKEYSVCVCACACEREKHTAVFIFLLLMGLFCEAENKIVKLALIDCLKYHGGFVF